MPITKESVLPQQRKRPLSVRRSLEGLVRKQPSPPARATATADGSTNPRLTQRGGGISRSYGIDAAILKYMRTVGDETYNDELARQLAAVNRVSGGDANAAKEYRNEVLGVSELVVFGATKKATLFLES